jgi:hypothetical protein
MIPFVSILEKGEEPFAMPRDLQINHPDRVFKVIRYPSVDRLVEILDSEIVRPARPGKVCPAGENEGGKDRRRGRLAAVRSLQEHQLTAPPVRVKPAWRTGTYLSPGRPQNGERCRRRRCENDPERGTRQIDAGRQARQPGIQVDRENETVG